jgi:acyl-homoserine-lactone acylase
VRPTHRSIGLVAAAAVFAATLPLLRAAAVPDGELWREVEVVRTSHGVPHIRATTLRAASYALAWVMSEDYGARTGLRLVGARGELSRFEGRGRIESDFANLRARARAIETYHLLDQDTRDVYDGFAAGINRFVARFPEQFPAGMPTDFSGHDVATLDIGDGPPPARVRRFLAALEGQTGASAGSEQGQSGVGAGPEPGHSRVRAGPELGQSSATAGPEQGQSGVRAGSDPGIASGDGSTVAHDEGSNAWALAPSRTKTGRAILLRNPHLAWTAGYYEAHVTVPGVLDFYGDFRIGGPLILIGGFNRHLGWATTNSNSGDLTEFYALDRDPVSPDRYLLDGASLPIAKHTLGIDVRTGETLVRETREFQSTPLGPVVYVDHAKIYVARTAGDGEFRAGEQFLRMMRARSLNEWKDAMRMRALVTSNYTYADRAGNIFYLWNAALPRLPHPPGGDTGWTPARTMRDLWTRYIPFEHLPQVRNPRGGYLHNENDSPHFANMRGRIETANAYPNMEPPQLRLRSQHAIALIDRTRKLSLEDVVRLKHSYRMLLADRVKRDLVAAVRMTRPSGDVADALALLRRWDNTAAPTSRGGVLFEIWYQRYSQQMKSAGFARPWSDQEPLRTPAGLADPRRAAEAFVWAVEETAKRYGRVDVAWGEVHRVRRGAIDVPVGGCSGQLGCFRVLTFTRAQDGKLVADGGDGWVLAVEFADPPRAYSVLAYGQSPNQESPWHADQAAMFARGAFKRVAFTAGDVDRAGLRRYRPGE